MKLVDLDPRWLDHNGRHIALILLCPCCRRWRLSCFFVPERKFQVNGEWLNQYDLLEDVARSNGWAGDAAVIVGCKDGIAWTRTSDDFASLSITPSLDASACGHWHGIIAGGEAH